jgi:hypothetical protein
MLAGERVVREMVERKSGAGGGSDGMGRERGRSREGKEWGGKARAKIVINNRAIETSGDQEEGLCVCVCVRARVEME